MDTTTSPTAPTTPDSGEGLRAELSLIDAAAFSVGLIGPVGAIGLLGTGAAVIIGRAVILSFVFAVVGVALVGYGFVKLSQHISHTGSVYALGGVTLGPRAGFFCRRSSVSYTYKTRSDPGGAGTPRGPGRDLRGRHDDGSVCHPDH